MNISIEPEEISLSPAETWLKKPESSDWFSMIPTDESYDLLRTIWTEYSKSNFHKSSSLEELGLREPVGDEPSSSEFFELAPGRQLDEGYFVVLQIALLLEVNNIRRFFLYSYLKRYERKFTRVSRLEPLEMYVGTKVPLYEIPASLYDACVNLLELLYSKFGSYRGVKGHLVQYYSKALNRLRCRKRHVAKVKKPQRKKGYTDKGSMPSNPPEARARREADSSMGPKEWKLNEIVRQIRELEERYPIMETFGNTEGFLLEKQDLLHQVHEIVNYNTELSRFVPKDLLDLIDPEG